MPQSMTTAEAGRIGSRKRWHDHVPVRPYIGDLTNAQRKLVVAAIQAEREKAAPVSEMREAATSEVRDHGAEPTS
jgi:hypothetical protein